MEGFGLCFLSRRLTDYLYVVAWSDALETCGVLGSFSVSDPSISYLFKQRHTGYNAWKVYATGVARSSLCDEPTMAEINSQVLIANLAAGATGVTSRGWVGVTPKVGREGVLAIGSGARKLGEMG